ncbi:Hypothetical predicted protein [Paramuricea clavata]|uniref:Uncharacterized protein n=1 Tax=Paramuricea clavata TaxID=317549 RepID=A0A7D9JIG7_PARCT|nr:Hypothetical predicted protein [Paramuricea clavata]
MYTPAVAARNQVYIVVTIRAQSQTVLTCKQSYPIASMYKKESESYTSKSKKKERTQQHPSIFKNDSESDDPESHESHEYVPSPLPGAHTGNEDSRSESGSDSEAALSDFYNEAEDSQDDQPPGPDGGRKNMKCSLQCSRQVQLVAAAINPESPKVSDLFDRKILRDSWLTKFEKEKQPETVKSYLGSLNLFFTFSKCEQLGQQYGVAHDQLGVLSDQMRQWNKSYRNLVKHRFWVKRMEDLANLKTPPTCPRV